MPAAGRVLVTTLPAAATVRALAARYAEGAIVVLAPRESIFEARKECAALEHVLFVEGTREEIPWAEAWFDAVLDPLPDAPTPEMLRVLRPGGSILPLDLPAMSSGADCPQTG
ncbi:MAG: hypothetical protein WHT08_07220 [Bryobacteraceae bacterium]|jgi:ubiquinone/menaquinone biosynthesis C-methylase UbiE